MALLSALRLQGYRIVTVSELLELDTELDTTGAPVMAKADRK